MQGSEKVINELNRALSAELGPVPIPVEKGMAYSPESH
jgi:hypothetical protein